MTTPEQTPPPKIPGAIGIKYKDGALTTGSLWSKWSVPLEDARVQSVPGTGRKVTVVMSSPSGETRQKKITGVLADYTASWVVAFNAWQEAMRGR